MRKKKPSSKNKKQSSFSAFLARLKPGTLRQRLLLFAVVFAVIGGTLVFVSFADHSSGRVVDFRAIHPNEKLSADYYLSGYNYASNPDSPNWSVLWFDEMTRIGRFRMYNSNPASKDARCHWDQFTWTVRYLRYSQTRDKCDGNNTDIRYRPGIVYLPRAWQDGTYWTHDGQSAASYFEGMQLKCKGVTSWTAEVFADRVEIEKGVRAIHVRNTQNTTWTEGVGAVHSTCKPGEVDVYEENLYFVDGMPVRPELDGQLEKQRVSKPQREPGLRRSVGGNLDRYKKTNTWDWDVWVDEWRQLPSEVNRQQ
jgi:hypothetical protein